MGIPAVTTSVDKQFRWNITLTQGATNNYLYSDLKNQTVKPINFYLCNATVPNVLINFSVVDEQSGVAVPAIFNSFFNYFIGDGTTIKNYSYSNPTINVTKNTSSFAFCNNINGTLKTDVDISYSNPAYLPRTYNGVNMQLTNVTTLVPLNLLNSSVGVKFYFTVIRGAGTRVTDSNVQIDRFIVANGTYTANSNKLTDGSGQFVEYLQQDQKYKFTISKDGTLIGIVEKTATCLAAPCEITLQIDAVNPNNVLDYYNLIYANNTVSSLVYNPDTKIVTYTFTDLTGAAHYFRLLVNKVVQNSTTQTICDTTSFTTSGTLICDMTTNDGDFIAKGYISRSPEILDKVLSFFINTLNTLEKSPYVLLFFIGWIITITFGALAVSRGNPSTVLGGFMIAWTSAKLMGINPFNWVIVVLVNLLAYWIMSEIGS